MILKTVSFCVGSLVGYLSTDSIIVGVVLGIIFAVTIPGLIELILRLANADSSILTLSFIFDFETDSDEAKRFLSFMLSMSWIGMPGLVLLLSSIGGMLLTQSLGLAILIAIIFTCIAIVSFAKGRLVVVGDDEIAGYYCYGKSVISISKSGGYLVPWFMTIQKDKNPEIDFTIKADQLMVTGNETLLEPGKIVLYKTGDKKNPEKQYTEDQKKEILSNEFLNRSLALKPEIYVSFKIGKYFDYKRNMKNAEKIKADLTNIVINLLKFYFATRTVGMLNFEKQQGSLDAFLEIELQKLASEGNPNSIAYDKGAGLGVEIIQVLIKSFGEPAGYLDSINTLGKVQIDNMVSLEKKRQEEAERLLVAQNNVGIEKAKAQVKKEVAIVEGEQKAATDKIDADADLANAEKRAQVEVTEETEYIKQLEGKVPIETILTHIQQKTFAKNASVVVVSGGGGKDAINIAGMAEIVEKKKNTNNHKKGGKND